MKFIIDEEKMVFENNQYVTEMLIKGKGEGQDGGEPRLRCAVEINLRVKETQNELNLKANIYWDTKYPKTHPIFTGGSLVEFIENQNHSYEEFKKYWDKVKRLSSNVFTDDEILEYQKMMQIR
ncbi:hypothetical protein [Ornithinibacillus halophilus]|uniref:Uncharacterized protein n=1 Tax=Ornithinibacillus halophilus TaxID=930117 RepID=A0A1M5MKE0_9BACI|nr:hypothetical protein [Ornithinibacillus halophilus]SHG77657.1 hypothetical protein SAMN05216225_106013 [Ornithinibacillus halophilus]